MYDKMHVSLHVSAAWLTQTNPAKHINEQTSEHGEHDIIVWGTEAPGVWAQPLEEVSMIRVHICWQMAWNNKSYIGATGVKWRNKRQQIINVIINSISSFTTCGFRNYKID